MKKRKLVLKLLTITLLSILSSQFVLAQKEIKTTVKEIKQEVESEGYFFVHKVELNSMLAVIGLQTTQLTFYYLAWQSNGEEDPHEMDARLIKLEVKYNILVSAEYTQEYIFDEEEDLIYYMYKEEGAYNNESLYYYFEKGELIQLEEKSQDMNQERHLVIPEFDDEEGGRVEEIKLKANTYLEVFKNLRDMEQLK